MHLTISLQYAYCQRQSNGNATNHPGHNHGPYNYFIFRSTPKRVPPTRGTNIVQRVKPSYTRQNSTQGSLILQRLPIDPRYGREKERSRSAWPSGCQTSHAQQGKTQNRPPKADTSAREGAPTTRKWARLHRQLADDEVTPEKVRIPWTDRGVGSARSAIIAASSGSSRASSSALLELRPAIGGGMPGSGGRSRQLAPWRARLEESGVDPAGGSGANCAAESGDSGRFRRHHRRRAGRRTSANFTPLPPPPVTPPDGPPAA